MKKVNLSEARRLLPALADEVARTGRAVLITRRGRPLATLTRASPEIKGSLPLRGLPIQIAADFDEPLDGWEALEP